MVVYERKIKMTHSADVLSRPKAPQLLHVLLVTSVLLNNEERRLRRSLGLRNLTSDLGGHSGERGKVRAEVYTSAE